MSLAGQLSERIAEHALDLTDRIAQNMVRRIQTRVPRRTGELHDSIEADAPERQGDTVVTRIRAGAEHASYVDRGTGPRGLDGGPPITPIPPTRALHFDSPILGEVFAASTQGMEPNRFWADFLESDFEAAGREETG